MYKLLTIIALLFIVSSTVHASSLNIELEQDLTDTIFVNLLGFDFSTYPTITFSASSNAQDQGIVLTQNPYFTTNGLELTYTSPCVGPIRDCIQPNEVYIFTIDQTGDTITVTSDSNSVLDFLPVVEPPTATTTVSTVDELKIFSMLWFLFISNLLVVIFVFRPFLYVRK